MEEEALFEMPPDEREAPLDTQQPSTDVHSWKNNGSSCLQDRDPQVTFQIFSAISFSGKNFNPRSQAYNSHLKNFMVIILSAYSLQ